MRFAGDYRVYGTTHWINGEVSKDDWSLDDLVNWERIEEQTTTGPNPPSTWAAGHVNRWHTNDSHALRNSHDSNHQHSARVALLIMHLFPDADIQLIKAAPHHDLPEKKTGDMSGETKREIPELANILETAEADWHFANGTVITKDPRLKLCDSIDAILWAWSVDPALMARDDWQRHIQQVLTSAGALGVRDQVKEILG